MLNQYIEYLKGQEKSKNTIERYVYNMKQWFQFAFNTIEPTIERLKSINPIDITTWVNTKKSSSHKAQIINTIRSFYLYLVYIKALRKDENFTDEVKVPKVTNKNTEYLTEDHARKLLKLIQTEKNEFDIRNYAMVLTFLTTGVRRTEFCNLDRKDLTNDKLIVRNGKGKKSREIPLPKQTKDAIERYLKTRQDNIEALFISKKKKRISGVRVYALIKKYLKKVKSTATVHALRHTCISLLLNGGANMESIRRLAGHENLATTTRYLHLNNDKYQKDIINHNPLNNLK
jgi:integrase/recombinase XerD